MDDPKPHSRYLVVDGLSYVPPQVQWLERWRSSGVACAHTTVAIWENAPEALARLAAWRRLLLDNSEIAALATSAAEVREVVASGRIAVLWGFQNTAPIEHDIELIGTFHQLGVRIVQLTYNLQNYVGSGYWESTDAGVSRFGRLVIEEMNRLGVMIDLSHCGDRTTIDAISSSVAPVAITHSNPRDYVGSPPFGSGRLKTTEALRELGRRQGVIGLSPLDSIWRSEGNTVEAFADMICWTADLIGVGSVGVGSDYCPGHPPEIVNWWRYAKWSRETVAELGSREEGDHFPAWFLSGVWGDTLADELLARGFSSGEVAGILGQNWLGLLERVETAAGQRPAIESLSD